MNKSKTRYVKLGSKAAEGSYYDPTLELKILPGKIVELPSNFRTSKKTVAALAGGHLEYVDSEEVAEYLNNLEVEEDEDEIISAAELKKYNKEQLKAFIKNNDEEADDDELEGMNKAELLETALELLD